MDYFSVTLKPTCLAGDYFLFLRNFFIKNYHLLFLVISIFQFMSFVDSLIIIGSFTPQLFIGISV